jgi:putative Mg2+ transporter-C (MgtC) family protein
MAAIIGGALGLERHLHGRWAGLRTHMTVALAAAVFVMGIDSPGSNVETARVIQGIAAGVGFLGAGTILQLSDRLEIKGLTTASSIWLTAALGTVVGLGRYSCSNSGRTTDTVSASAARQKDEVDPICWARNKVE